MLNPLKDINQLLPPAIVAFSDNKMATNSQLWQELSNIT
jgi:hypothetical protein